MKNNIVCQLLYRRIYGLPMCGKVQLCWSNDMDTAHGQWEAAISVRDRRSRFGEAQILLFQTQQEMEEYEEDNG